MSAFTITLRYPNITAKEADDRALQLILNEHEEGYLIDDYEVEEVGE